MTEDPETIKLAVQMARYRLRPHVQEARARLRSRGDAAFCLETDEEWERGNSLAQKVLDAYNHLVPKTVEEELHELRRKGAT